VATHTGTRSGAEVLVAQLLIHGVEIGYGVPGESYLAVLDALYDVRDKLRFIVCRQEGGAAYMAEAYGKLTGRPGICFVTRGPGATNASVGIHTARQDSTPLILFIGQVGRAQAGREAFQEIDFRLMYAPIAKWVAQIDDPARIPELVARAFSVATSGRPGPVVLALPEDMLRERVSVADAAPYRATQAAPDPADVEHLRQMLAQARRPLMLVGGSTWNKPAVADITAFAEDNRLATATTFRRQDHFDNLHPCYAGDLGNGANPRLAAAVKEADLIVAVGTRLDELSTANYTLLQAPRPHQKLVHVHAGAEELGKVYQPDLAINSGMAHFARALRQLAPVDSSAWAEFTAVAHQNYLDYTAPVGNPGALQLAPLIAWLREQLPAETIVANGAGNYTGWIHRFWHYRGLGTELAPVSGSMGYGVPAAIAAALIYPQRPVLSFSGDGCFLMNGQELATAMQYGAAPIFLVVNNGMYGTIRMHQESHYPGRVSATELRNPDFVALARAYGLYAERVEDNAGFAPAFARARAQGCAALLELPLAGEAITSRTTLSQLRAAALSHQHAAGK